MTTAAAPEAVRERAEVRPLGAAEPDAAPPARGRLRRFWFVPAGVALLGAAALVPSVGGGGPGAGEARVLVDGVAVVTDADGSATTVRDDRIDVGPGDQVAVREGRATFEMAGAVRLEGRGRHDGRAGTTVEMAIAPRLVTGALLAVAPSPIEIEAGGATVSIDPSGSVDGAARLDRRLGLGIGTYRGRVAVETAGRRAEVARHRRMEIAGPGALGPEGLPLRYEADDPWDRRFLGDALVIDAQVAPLLASLGTAEREAFLDPATLREAMPGLPGGDALADRLAGLDDGGEALVLGAIALAVEERSFASAWDQAAAFQADGAPWGLAAIDQGARSADVLPILRDALDTVDLQASTGDDAEVASDGAEAAADAPAAEGGTPPTATGADGAPPSTTVPGGGATDPGGSGGSGGLPVPPVPTVPTPTLPQLPTPTTPNVPEVVEGVGGAVGGTVGGVTDGVDRVVPGAGAVIDGVVGGVAGAVGGVGGVVGAAGEAVGGATGGIVGGLGGVVGGLGTGLGTGLGGSGTR